MNAFNKGILLGVGSGMTWGICTVLIGIILSFSVFSAYTESLFIGALTIVFLHDGASTLWLLGNLVREGKISDLKEIYSTVGLYLVLAAIIGGPIGAAGYLLGVKYIGPSYTASFSALYPALGTILTGLLLKEKITKRMMVGVVISGLGIFMLSYAPVDLTLYPQYGLGIIFALFCVLGWALESVVASYSMKYGEMNPSVAITIRQLTSTICYGLCIIPLIGAYPLVGEVLGDVTIMAILIVSALIGSLSYLFWYKSIDYIGAPRGMALNITYVIWTIIFESIYYLQGVSWQFMGAAFVIICGVILISAEPKEIFNRQ